MINNVSYNLIKLGVLSRWVSNSEKITQRRNLKNAKSASDYDIINEIGRLNESFYVKTVFSSGAL